MNNTKDIPGWEGLYAVTEDGQVWAHPRIRVRNGHKIPYSGYWRKITLTVHGYHTVTLHETNGGSNPRGFKLFVHRLVALTYLPEVKGKQYVNHIDGDKANNHVSNLEWCTYKENTRHAFETGLRTPPKGEQHGMSKMNESTVAQARSLYAREGYTKAALSRKFGVSKATMGKIINQTAWKHVLT